MNERARIVPHEPAEVHVDADHVYVTIQLPPHPISAYDLDVTVGRTEIVVAIKKRGEILVRLGHIAYVLAHCTATLRNGVLHIVLARRKPNA